MNPRPADIPSANVPAWARTNVRAGETAHESAKRDRQPAHAIDANARRGRGRAALRRPRAARDPRAFGTSTTRRAEPATYDDVRDDWLIERTQSQQRNDDSHGIGFGPLVGIESAAPVAPYSARYSVPVRPDREQRDRRSGDDLVRRETRPRTTRTRAPAARPHADSAAAYPPSDARRASRQRARRTRRRESLPRDRC